MSNAVLAEDKMEEIAHEVEKIQEAFIALRDSRLTRRAVVLLVHDMTKIGKRDIEKMLDSLPHLADHFLKPNDE